MPKIDPRLTDLLQRLCREHGKDLNLEGSQIDGSVFLAALLFCESSFGKNIKTRKEPWYSPGGKYFKDKLKKAFDKYGEGVCCSWGPWQIMYATAMGYGYKGEPDNLLDPAISLPIAIKYLNDGIDSGAGTVAQLADYYNSGGFKARKAPTGYVRKCVSAYNGLASEWLEGESA